MLIRTKCYIFTSPVTFGPQNEIVKFIITFGNQYPPFKTIRLINLYIDDIDCEDKRFSGLIKIKFHPYNHENKADEEILECIPEWTNKHYLTDISYALV